MGIFGVGLALTFAVFEDHHEGFILEKKFLFFDSLELHIAQVKTPFIGIGGFLVQFIVFFKNFGEVGIALFESADLVSVFCSHISSLSFSILHYIIFGVRRCLIRGRR